MEPSHRGPVKQRACGEGYPRENASVYASASAAMVVNVRGSVWRWQSASARAQQKVVRRTAMVNSAPA